MNRAKAINVAKYAGTSITLGTAITAIIIFAFPNLKEISEAISALVIFGVNLGLVWSGVLSDSE